MGEEITISMNLFNSIKKFILEEDSFGNGRAKELKGFVNDAYDKHIADQSKETEDGTV